MRDVGCESVRMVSCEMCQACVACSLAQLTRHSGATETSAVLALASSEHSMKTPLLRNALISLLCYRACPRVAA